MKLQLDYDPVTKVRRDFYIDDADPRKIAIETTQDKEAHYKANDWIKKHAGKCNIGDWGRAVADIPYEDYMDLCIEYPELRAKGPGAAEARQAAIRKILTTHPKRHLWLWQDKF